MTISNYVRMQLAEDEDSPWVVVPVRSCKYCLHSTTVCEKCVIQWSWDWRFKPSLRLAELLERRRKLDPTLTS